MNAQSEPEREISVAETEQAQRVMSLFANAIEAAGQEGIPSEVIGSAALAAALRMLVAVHGADTVSKLIGALPERVESGDFSD